MYNIPTVSELYKKGDGGSNICATGGETPPCTTRAVEPPSNHCTTGTGENPNLCVSGSGD